MLDISDYIRVEIQFTVGGQTRTGFILFPPALFHRSSEARMNGIKHLACLYYGKLKLEQNVEMIVDLYESAKGKTALFFLPQSAIYEELRAKFIRAMAELYGDLLPIFSPEEVLNNPRIG